LITAFGIYVRETDPFGIYRFEWLKIIEPNSTALYEPRIRSISVHPWTLAEIFPEWATPKFCLSFTGC